VIVATPVAMPVTTPVEEPTVATDELLLVQLPPATDSVSEILEPAQTVEGPDIAVGTGVTVTVL
jgi:hypothetical protein